jgi:hypothetical protein
VQGVSRELGHFTVDGHGVEITSDIVRRCRDQCALHVVHAGRVYEGQVLGVGPPERWWLWWWRRSGPQGLFETHVFGNKARCFSIGDIGCQHRVALLTQVECLVQHVEGRREKVAYHVWSPHQSVLEYGKTLLEALLPLRLLEVFRRYFVPESILRVLTQARESSQHLRLAKLLPVALGDAK